MLDRPDHLALEDRLSAPAEIARIRDLVEAWAVDHLRVRARCGGEIPAPFAGSIVRGALGASLRAAACTEGPGGACPECAGGQGCLYAALFEPSQGRRGSRGRPFSIVPPARIVPGKVEFEVKLFGLAAVEVEAVLAAIGGMGRAGIGRDRVPFEIEEVRPFHFGGGRLLGPSAAGGGATDIFVTLRTPLRMKEAGRLRSDLPPERLVRGSLRRLTEIGAALGQEWPRAWPGILGALAGARVERADLRWLDWGRYSLRQRSPMRLGGAVGEVQISGMPSALVPVLRAAAFAGLGKNTSFGLGAIDIREVP